MVKSIIAMQAFLDIYSSFWSIIESIFVLPAVAITLYLFFKDPVKRWSFLGYLPTAIVIIFDPNEKKLLLIKNKGTWGFPQGGIFGADVTSTVEQTLKRELDISSTEVEIRYARPLGKVKISDKYRTKRITLGVFSVASQIKGKGYVVYYTAARIDMLKKKLKLGYGISSPTITSVGKAKQLFESLGSEKDRLLVEALDELEGYLDSAKINA